VETLSLWERHGYIPVPTCNRSASAYNRWGCAAGEKTALANRIATKPQPTQRLHDRIKNHGEIHDHDNRARTARSFG
jgi:hypothetical protein